MAIFIVIENMGLKKILDRCNLMSHIYLLMVVITAIIGQNDIINIHDALYWLPNNSTQNNRASFMELIDKHLFYIDDHRTKKHRDLADFEIIAKSWQYLSDEERKSD